MNNLQVIEKIKNEEKNINAMDITPDEKVNLIDKMTKNIYIEAGYKVDGGFEVPSEVLQATW